MRVMLREQERTKINSFEKNSWQSREKKHIFTKTSPFLFPLQIWQGKERKVQDVLSKNYRNFNLQLFND